MALTEKILGQSPVTRIEGTPTTIYTPGTGVTAIVRSILLANLDDDEVEVAIFAGPTYKGPRECIAIETIQPNASSLTNIYLPLLKADTDSILAEIITTSAPSATPGASYAFADADPDTLSGAASEFASFRDPWGVVEVRDATTSANNGFYQYDTRADALLTLNSNEAIDTAENYAAGTDIYQCPLVMTICGAEITA